MIGPNEPLMELEPGSETLIFIPKFQAKFVSVYSMGKPVPMSVHI